MEREPPGGEQEEEDVDLTLEQRRSVARMFDQLTNLTLYELLEVPLSADRKAIKRAYNERVMVFHPDRFFQKRLGSFKPKLDAIIRRLTQAHDVLCSPDLRTQYDTALRSQRSSLIDAMLEEAVASIEVEDLRNQKVSIGPDPVRISEPPATPRPAVATSTLPRSTVATSTPPRPAVATSTPPQSNLQARREVLAARLRTPSREMKPVSASIAKATPMAGFTPMAKQIATPTTSVRPEVISIERAVARLRELHAKEKRAPLQGPDRLIYERLREDFARSFVAAQQLTLREGQTPRQALRVACAIRIVLTLDGVQHRTMTLDLAVGGLSALLGSMPSVGGRCDFSIEIAPEPIKGKGRIANVTRHGTTGNAFRTSVAFDPSEPATTARLEALVLDHALANVRL